LAQCVAKPVFGLGLSVDELAAEIEAKVRQLR